jgi:hypothetical protein
MRRARLYPAEAERLQVVGIDARRHLVLLLDSHRRRAHALAAINRDDAANTFCGLEPPPGFPRRARQPLSAATVPTDQGDR